MPMQSPKNSPKLQVFVAMDSNGGKIPTPFQPFHRHHHHVFYISPQCPLHRAILQPKNHSPSCSISSCSSDQIPESVPSIPPNSHSNPLDNHLNPAFDDFSLMRNEVENLEVEEEVDPVFVLTDEWRDFFAKSEAKRKQEKKKARKGKK